LWVEYKDRDKEELKEEITRWDRAWKSVWRERGFERIGKSEGARRQCQRGKTSTQSGDSRREVCGGQNVTSWKYPHSADWILSSTAASVVT
jgi:hypothetical protein